jgi:putative PIN family toxin of toxin-antitoxin system
MSPERFVVDSNVLISAALLAESVPARCLAHVLNQARLVFCPETFGELHSRLWRPKFDRYVSLEDRKLFLRDLQAVAEWVDLPPVAGPALCTDPDDEKFLRLALAAQATALISGDRDLTSLGSTAGVPVWTPAQALRRFK